jgi:hypothetical protein
MKDDWRLRIELSDAGRFLERLLNADARELADTLRHQRLAVTRDGDRVFVYAPNRLQAEEAQAIVEQEIGGEGRVTLEQWLAAEERWSDEPPHPPAEEALLERGYAPWEVRVSCSSREEAARLTKELREEGYSVARAFRYVIAGTESRTAAAELARRVHGEVEPGGELVYEALPSNPFAFFGGLFGGLGETGSPL